MKIFMITSLMLTTAYGDIGLKLRQQQQQQQNGGFNFVGDVKNNPFFIPKSEAGSLGSAGSAATNVEQKATANTKTERTHTLEELCNDAFHSFLCKPVNGRRRRIDGNLRPGAVLPPGFLRPESSNTRENKLLPPQGPQTAPARVSPNNKHHVDSQVPAAQSEQGYFYPKPSNTFEFNKPLRNGYLPPDNNFRSTAPPTIQTTRYSQIATTRPPQTSRLPPLTFPTTTRRPLTTQSTTRRPVQNNIDIRFQTTPRPIITTRIPTTRPTPVFTPSKPSFIQPVKYEPPKVPALNTYLPPIKFSTTQATPTTRQPFFTRPTSRPTFTTRTPSTTRRPPPPPPSPPIRFTTSTFRPPTISPVTFTAATTKLQTLPNTYLPPFAEQKFNPVIVSTTTPRPTFKPISLNSISTVGTVKTPTNSYLPPTNPAIDVRFGSASNTRDGTALLPDAAQNQKISVKPDEEDNLERLCNDPFHSFLCQPITKTRYRFDGRLRPQAVIPQGILLPSSSFDSPIRSLPELQSGTNIQPSILSGETGYIYRNPNSLQSGSQPVLGYVIPMPTQNLLLSADANSVASSGYFYPNPTKTEGINIPSASIQTSQLGYEYPKPNNPFNLIASTLSPTVSTVNERFTTVFTTPRATLGNNLFSQQNNLLTIQNTNNEPFIVTTTEKSESFQKGYDYPKPSLNQQFTFPSSSLNSATFEPKTETQFIYTTTTPRSTTLLPDRPTITTSPFRYQTIRPQVTLFTGYDNKNPTGGPALTVSTTERPSTLLYSYQNPAINQVSPSPSPQTFINYQKPLSSVSTERTQSIGYSYPKPENPLLEQPTVNVAQGYFYPKPSVSFPDNSLNSFGSNQFFKNSPNPVLSTFSKGISFSPNQPSPPVSLPFQQQPFRPESDEKAAKNINQLLGPSNDSSNRDLPPASQFEILKVKKRQNG